jgi:hypothetical protein
MKPDQPMILGTENTNPPKAPEGGEISRTLIRTRQERFQGPIPPPDALKA